MDSEKLLSTLILPVGTQVVTRVDLLAKDSHVRREKGAVGTIIKAPSDNSHAYLIRFPDGAEHPFRRNELSILKEVQRDGFQPPEGAFDKLTEFIIYKCVVGSRAYGLEHEMSDTDRRGIYLPPADLHWSLYGVPEQLDMPESEECYFEIQKFIVLALKANPNILECLYTPLVEHSTPIADELLAMRSCFLSKIVYQTYNGYVLSQFKKLEQDVRTTGSLKWKHAMHLLRLLLSGIEILKEAHVPVRVSNHRDMLLEIKAGQRSWEKINEWRLELHKEFDNARNASRLPERPDYKLANDFLLHARRSVI